MRWLALMLAQILVFGGAFFGLGELVARYVLDVRPLTSDFYFFEYHPRWGWAHRPNADGNFVRLGFEEPIKINSRGLREREIPYEKPPGVTRVLVIGDSNVAGFEVKPEEVWPRVAESLLRDRGYRVEFINAGHRGWGTDQSLLFLMDEGMKYHPDLVLYFWSDNDLDDNVTIHRPYREYGKPYFDLDANGGLVLEGVPVPQFAAAEGIHVGEDGRVVRAEVPVLMRASLWLRDSVIVHSAFATWLTHVVAGLPNLTRSVLSAGSYGDFRGSGMPELDPQGRSFRLALALVRQMQRVASEGHAKMYMLGVSGEWPTAIRKAAGMPEYRVYERYRDRIPSPEAVRTRMDPHWNALGHRLYAETLVETLEASDLLPPPATPAPDGD
jgi:hypothetical protein